MLKRPVTYELLTGAMVQNWKSTSSSFVVSAVLMAGSHRHTHLAVRAVGIIKTYSPSAPV